MRRCAGACTAAFFVFLSPAFSASRQPVDYGVSVGFDDTVPSTDSICPVTVTINNQVGSTRGEIKLTQPDPSGGYEVTHRIPFESPSPSVKRFTLMTRLETGRSLVLSVTFDDYIRPIQRELKVQRSDKPIVVCIGAQPLLKTGKTGEYYRFLSSAGPSMPDNPVALDGAHAIVFGGLAFASLDKGQIDALRQWTAGGGRLVFADCPSDEAFRANFSRLAGSSPVNPALRGVNALGAGVVACAGAGIQGDGAFWESDRKMTAALFPRVTEPEDDGNTFSYVSTGRGTGHFTSLWKTNRSYGFLGFASIVLIVGAYVLVIGPGDWWLVRRFKKPYLTWIIFTGAIALFSLIAYSYSRLVNVGSMRAVHVNVLDTSLDTPVARGDSQFWVYSAKNTSYRMDTPQKDVVFSARESSQSVGFMAGVSIANGADSSLTARIPIFSSKEFDASWYAPWQHKVVCSEKEGRLSVVLPEELKASYMYVADSLGITTLNESGSVWVAAEHTVRWNDAIWSYAESLGSPMNAWTSPKGDIMPSEEALRHYLLCMSFPWKIDEKQDDWRSVSMYRSGRNAREASMDVRYRLAGGRVLLVFLNTQEGLLPISFSRYHPKTERIDLVRIQIPERL